MDNMLTDSQKAYLENLSPKRAAAPVIVEPFNLQTQIIAENIIASIMKIFPQADIRFMGASALGISGQNDIDIYILYTEAKEKDAYLSKLHLALGEQKGNKWKWIEGGYQVSVKLESSTTRKFKEQLEIFDVFINNPDILKKYEELKKSMNGQPYRGYQEKKYKFYNTILGIE